MLSMEVEGIYYVTNLTLSTTKNILQLKKPRMDPFRNDRDVTPPLPSRNLSL